MNEEKYKVYVYTNQINGKKYVGQTRRSLEVRAGKNGRGYSKCTHFNRAIQKWGWENFEGEVIYDNLSKEEANNYEMQLIQKFQTTNVEFGYNITPGGYNIDQHLKIPVIQFNLDFNYIKRYDSMCAAEDETGVDKSHIANACRHKYNQAGGFIWLFEKDYVEKNYDKEHMLYLIHKEYKHPNSCPVIQCDLNMNFIAIYKNICEASRQTGVNRSGINDVCTHKLKTSGGYIWMYENEYIQNKDRKDEISTSVKTSRHKKHGVVKLDINMNFIAEYSSVLQASKETNTDRKSITNVCKGVSKQAKGYIWMYSSEYYAQKDI